MGRFVDVRYFDKCAEPLHNIETASSCPNAHRQMDTHAEVQEATTPASALARISKLELMLVKGLGKALKWICVTVWWYRQPLSGSCDAVLYVCSILACRSMVR